MLISSHFNCCYVVIIIVFDIIFVILSRTTKHNLFQRLCCDYLLVFFAVCDNKSIIWWF